MKLRTKFFLIVLAILLSLMTIVGLSAKSILLSSYEELEHSSAQNDLERTLNTLWDEVDTIDSSCSDWAYWDDLYQYMADRNSAFKRANLIPSVFDNLKLNFMVILNPKGQVVWNLGYDLSTGSVTPLPQGIDSIFALNSPIMKLSTGKERASGFISLPEGIVYLSAHAILPSDKIGPPRGILIMGRRLNAAKINALSERTKLTLSILPAVPVIFPLSIQGFLTKLTPENPFLVLPQKEKVLGLALIQDILGRPSLILRLDLPRHIYNQGQAAIRMVLIVCFIIGVVFLGLTLFLVDDLVMIRLSFLSRQVGQIGEQRSPGARVILSGKDELNRLAMDINIMLAELEQNEFELKYARNVAEAANRSKTEFLANMSHEIRTPLNSVIGMADLLKESPLDEQSKEYVRVLGASSDHLLDVISDILDLSKIEAGYLVLDETKFDLLELSTDLFVILSHRAKENGLTLSYGVGVGVPLMLLGDQLKLKQILMNLLGNALKFTEQGEVSLRIALAQSPAKISRKNVVALSFTVEDSGIGIAKSKLKTIFEAFTQADSSTTRRFGGTGLGLTITRKLIDFLGGKLSVTSEEGQGSSFSFTLPLTVMDQSGRQASEVTVVIPPEAKAIPHPEELYGPDETQSVGLNRTSPTGQSQGLRILLVEDNLSNQTLFYHYLAGTPHQVTMSPDGEDAVTKYTTGVYDLVLMDLQLPIMDGFTATRQIREWERARELQPTPIVALSAHASKEDIRQCAAAGCDGHLIKPIKRAAFLAEIRKRARAHLDNPALVCLAVDPDLKDIIQPFIDNLWQSCEAMSQAVVEKNADALFSIAHDLKGSGAGYGLDFVSETGQIICDSVRSKDIAAAPEQIAALRKFLKFVRVEWQAE